ncbi:MAG: molecular chaperone DnaJ [Patescibacteria group bacterium]|nr:molecular chaperone DnaJ [Patescibacteria group bacterium]MDD5490571.1 molecular chaperone DnaJ [Patescibacteria group bacterium]
MSKDYYKILGIEKSASAEEVKRAFRQLAHKYHPDKEGGDEAKFKEINEAYQVLGNLEKRKQYDQFGTTFENMGAGGFGGGNPFGGFQSGGFNINMDDLGDLFGGLGDIFGGSFGGQRTKTATRAKGRDIEVDLQIDFREAVFGGEKELELYKNIICERCGGSGAEPGSKIISCVSCGGAGRVRKVQRTFLGAMETSSVCPECRGAGNKPEKLCSECRGAGIKKGNEKIKVKIPAGINSGDTVKYSGKGEAVGRDGLAGNLYVNFNVKPHPEFSRDAFDILNTITISFPQAALGDKVEVSTIDGSVNLKIPAGTQSGTIFRIKGRGVPKLRGSGRGDQLVTVKVEVPKNLTRKQKKMLEEWGKE